MTEMLDIAGLLKAGDRIAWSGGFGGRWSSTGGLGALSRDLKKLAIRSPDATEQNTGHPYRHSPTLTGEAAPVGALNLKSTDHLFDVSTAPMHWRFNGATRHRILDICDSGLASVGLGTQTVRVRRASVRTDMPESKWGRC